SRFTLTRLRVFFSGCADLRDLPSFPTRRSSDLAAGGRAAEGAGRGRRGAHAVRRAAGQRLAGRRGGGVAAPGRGPGRGARRAGRLREGAAHRRGVTPRRDGAERRTGPGLRGPVPIQTVGRLFPWNCTT